MLFVQDWQLNNALIGQTAKATEVINVSIAYDVARALNNGQEPTTNNAGYLTYCPAHDDKAGGKPSLSIVDSNESHGITVLCHRGCDWKDIKDALAEQGLIEKFNGKKISAAKITTNATPDASSPRSSPSPPLRKSGSLPWDKAKIDDASTALITKYFAGRKIFFNDKFPMPRCFRWGSYFDKKNNQQVCQIVAAATKLGDKEMVAVQRLFVEVDGDKVIKTGMKMLGACRKKGVWLDRKSTMKDLIVAEGIETTLSVMQATGFNGVSALSTAGMKAIMLPGGIERLYICVDSDKRGTGTFPGYAGQEAGIALAERVEKDGAEGGDATEVFLCTPCKDCFTDNPTKLDFNDLSPGEIVVRMSESVKMEQLEWRPPEKKDTASDTGDGYYTSIALQGLEKINGSYAVVIIGGKFRIIREKRNKLINFMDKTSFLDLHANVQVPIQVGDNVKSEDVGKLWIKWPGRRQYEDIAFDPGMKIEQDVYNLFRGFPLKPVQGDWNLMLDHIKKVVCDGDETVFLYVMAWMARAIQDPGGLRPGVALVLMGGRGSGKGIFVNAFGKLFGESFLPISSEDGFLGRFNMHLAKGLLIFLDEAIWAGSKPSEGKLKALITEPKIMYEAKGIDSIALDNFMNIIIASNEEWAVPAGIDERRFCVLKQNESRKKDYDYFDAIAKQMDNGGYEAMYYDLLHYEYSEINLKNAPETKGLRSQVEETFNVVQVFWQDVLSRENLLTNRDGQVAYTDYRPNTKTGEIEPEPELWPLAAWKDEIYGEFLRFCKNDNRRYKKTNEVHFWKSTYKVVLSKEEWFFLQSKKRRFFILPAQKTMQTSFSKKNGGVSFEESALEEFDNQF